METGQLIVLIMWLFYWIPVLREKGVSSINYRKPVEFSSGLCESQDINVKTEKKSHNWRSYTNKIKRSDSENINCVDAFFKNESSKTVETKQDSEVHVINID